MTTAGTSIPSTHKAAEFYIALGWPVIPIWPIHNGRCACGNPDCKSPGKHPIGRLVPNGVKDATCDLAVITAWWNRYSDANIATATGAPSGAFAVDIDPHKGGDDSWADLEAQYGRVDTVEQQTGGGGMHYLFQHVPGLGNSSGKLGPGIDTRGDGGYILLPPSSHISGRRYEWEVSSHPGKTKLAPIPDWLLDLLRESGEAETTVSFDADATAVPELSRFNLPELTRVTIEQGTPNGSDRSAVDQSVITSLVKHGASDDEILAIFRHYPIGTMGKFADKGKHAEAYLAHSIGRARALVAGQPDAATNLSGSTPQNTSDNGRVMSLQAIPMADLLAQSFSPLEFLVDELMALGHLVVLAGRPKSGKTWLVLQLAMCIDMGRPFLEQKTRKAKVLYIALEDSKRRVYQRAKMLKWQPEQASIVFDIARFDGADGLPGPGLTQIANEAETYDLIIIDTLIATLSGQANENDNAQMGAIINRLAQIAHETDTAILLVHHTGKSFSDDVFNTLRGASAIRGGYDVGLLLERKQDEAEAVLYAESRDVDVENMTLRQAANGVGWEYIGNSNEIKKIRAGRKVVEAILELDPDGDGVTVKEIAEHRGVSESAIYKQIKGPVADGYIGKIEMPSTEDGKQPDLFYVREQYR